MKSSTVEEMFTVLKEKQGFFACFNFFLCWFYCENLFSTNSTKESYKAVTGLLV